MTEESLTEFLGIDVFELLGLTDLTDQEKERRQEEMDGNVLYDFLKNDVPELLNDEQLAEIDGLADKEGLTLTDIVEKLVKFIPDIEDMILQKTIDYRVAMVIEFIKMSSEICEKQKALLDNGVTPNPATPFTDKVKRMEELESDRMILNEVLALYEEGKWLEGAGKLQGLSRKA